MHALLPLPYFKHSSSLFGSHSFLTRITLLLLFLFFPAETEEEMESGAGRRYSIRWFITQLARNLKFHRELLCGWQKPKQLSPALLPQAHRQECEPQGEQAGWHSERWRHRQRRNMLDQSGCSSQYILFCCSHCFYSFLLTIVLGTVVAICTGIVFFILLA